MGRLDASGLRYVTRDQMRLLHAVEVCQRNHELVPAQLAAGVAQLTAGGGGSCCQLLLRQLQQLRLLAYERGRRYDGYRLTVQGYDYLALNALVQSQTVEALGAQIGTGKESDVYTAYDANGGRPLALKFHRLGRNSFRRLKLLRNYHAHRRHVSWLYLSRLSAAREFAFMRALYERGVRVPRPVRCNRHAVLMALVPGVPLCQWGGGGGWVQRPSVRLVADLWRQCMDLIVQLAECGVVHCDFNEFNLMVVDDSEQEQETDHHHHHQQQQQQEEKEAERDEEAASGEQDQDSADSEDGSEQCDDEQLQVDYGDPQLVLIDLPQMVSTSHPNAQHLFDRDVQCLRRFFERRFHYVSVEQTPVFDQIVCVDDLYVKVRAGDRDAAEKWWSDGEDEDEAECGQSEAVDGGGSVQACDNASESDRDVADVGADSGAAGGGRDGDDSGVTDGLRDMMVTDGNSASVQLASSACVETAAAAAGAADGCTVLIVAAGGGAAVDNADVVCFADSGENNGSSISAWANTAAAAVERESTGSERESGRRERLPCLPVAPYDSCSVAESSIDPEQLQRRLRQQLHRKRRQLVERVRVKGDASAVTRGRRSNAATVRDSMTAFWLDGP